MALSLTTSIGLVGGETANTILLLSLKLRTTSLRGNARNAL